MQIREDFKFDPDNWRLEAKQLTKRSVNVILYICVLFPTLIFLATSYLSPIISSLIPSVVVAAMIIGCMYALLITLIFIPGYYMLYFFKKVDFGVKTGLISILSEIKNTFKSYISFAKDSRSLLFFTMIPVLVLSYMVAVSILQNNKPELFNYMSIFDLLSSSTNIVCISMLWTIGMVQKKILGVVYIGYDVVNVEGSYILTKMAYSKYPQLEDYITKMASKLNIYFLSMIAVKVILGNLARTPEMMHLISFSGNLIYIAIGCYHLAIVYIISRDLYGGKQAKQTVTVEQDIKNIVPDLT